MTDSRPAKAPPSAPDPSGLPTPPPEPPTQPRAGQGPWRCPHCPPGHGGCRPGLCTVWGCVMWEVWEE